MATRSDNVIDLRRTPLEKSPDPDFGTGIIPKERYTSAEFMRLEWERMWTKVWLVGGMERDLKEPGDYLVTEIGPESIMLVRQKDGKVRAFYNVCQHRGNRLRSPGLGTAESFQCHYHHWEYHLDGTIKRLPDEETFLQGRPCAGLEEMPCDTWGGFIWYSMNREVEPLREYLGIIPEHLEPYNFEKMALVQDVSIEWDCNWKTSVDAFNEAYHVQGIHPQLLFHLDDQHIQIDCYGRHSRYLIPFASVSPRVKTPPGEIPAGIRQMMMEAGMHPADYDGKVGSVRKDLQAFKRKHGAQQGKDYSRLHNEQLTDDYHYLVFPNVTLNVHSDDFWLFRQRPHKSDPDRMYFDFWRFELVAEGKEWPARPEPEQFRHGEKKVHLVLTQDAENLPGVQAGMHSRGYRGLWLGKQELRIRHFHSVLDEYLYGPGAKPAGAL